MNILHIYCQCFFARVHKNLWNLLKKMYFQIFIAILVFIWILYIYYYCN